jgi:hypothetical protein
MSSHFGASAGFLLSSPIEHTRAAISARLAGGNVSISPPLSTHRLHNWHVDAIAHQLMRKLREVHAALRTLTTPEAKAMEVEIASMLRSAKLEGADALMARAQAVVDAEMAKLAADARLRAVLGGLAKLGYEVRESMSTAWAQDGRLVVRKQAACGS